MVKKFKIIRKKRKPIKMVNFPMPKTKTFKIKKKLSRKVSVEERHQFHHHGWTKCLVFTKEKLHQDLKLK